jgi:hypothetical protein
MTQQNLLQPIYNLYLGKYTSPYQEILGGRRPDPALTECSILNVLETEEYLFVATIPMNHSYLMRPKSLNTGDRPTAQDVYYSGFMLGIYNKNNHDFVFNDILKTDKIIDDQHYFYLVSGISNDIDEGPRFFPFKSVNDSTMVMWLYPQELLEHVESNDFHNKVPEYPESKNELEVLTNSLSAFDNPVLMFVTMNQ